MYSLWDPRTTACKFSHNFTVYSGQMTVPKTQVSLNVSTIHIRRIILESETDTSGRLLL